MNNLIDYKFSIPEEYCTSELITELSKYGYNEIMNEANFTGTQFRSFIITTVGFLGGCITIADKFIPQDVNQIVIVVDGVDYTNLNMNKVNEIVRMAMEDQGQVASFPTSFKNNQIVAVTDKKND